MTDQFAKDPDGALYNVAERAKLVALIEANSGGGSVGVEFFTATDVAPDTDTFTWSPVAPFEDATQYYVEVTYVADEATTTVFPWSFTIGADAPSSGLANGATVTPAPDSTPMPGALTIVLPASVHPSQVLWSVYTGTDTSGSPVAIDPATTPVDLTVTDLEAANKVILVPAYGGSSQNSSSYIPARFLCPSDATLDFPIGTELLVKNDAWRDLPGLASQVGLGYLLMSAGPGATVRGVDQTGPGLLAGFAGRRMAKVAADTWISIP